MLTVTRRMMKKVMRKEKMMMMMNRLEWEATRMLTVTRRMMKKVMRKEKEMRNEHHSSGILLKIYHQIYNTNTATPQTSSVASNTITCVVTTTILSCFKSYYDNSNPTSFNIKLESESS